MEDKKPRRNKTKNLLIREVTRYLEQHGLNVVSGAKLEYVIGGYTIVAKPDILIYDSDELKAVIRIKTTMQKVSYDKLYLDLVTFIVGGIDSVTRQVLLLASNRHAALNASKHLIENGISPGRGLDWSILVWLYQSIEPLKYIERFISVLSGRERPTPARNPSICARCPVKPHCPVHSPQGKQVGLS